MRLHKFDNVWLRSGGVGWTKGLIVGVRSRAYRVRYARGLAWRPTHHVRPRDLTKNGDDKPPTRGRDRRRRCDRCGMFTMPADYRNGGNDRPLCRCLPESQGGIAEAMA